MTAFFSISIGITSAIFWASTANIHVAQAQETMLTGTVWELQQIQYNNDTRLKPDDPENYTIQFFEDSTVGIQADCNVVRGTYDTESAEFITLGASTLAACPPESIDAEFRTGLEEAAIYFFEDGNLYMDLPVDTGTLMFAPAEETAVIEEETEVIEEDIMEGTPEPSSEADPVRGLW